MASHAARWRPPHAAAARRARPQRRRLPSCASASPAPSRWSWHRVREIPRIELGTQLAADAGAVDDTPQNFLIVGTDTADGLPDDDPVRVGRDSGVRTDTIMLVRLDPQTERAALLLAAARPLPARSPARAAALGSTAPSRADRRGSSRRSPTPSTSRSTTTSRSTSRASATSSTPSTASRCTSPSRSATAGRA